MRRSLKYSDALVLLGGDSATVDAVDRALGGVATIATGGGFALLQAAADGRGEVVRLGHHLVGKVRDWRYGLSRFQRTQLLLAAHTVLTLTAFFEALDEIDFPFDVGAVQLTGEDQLRIAGLRDRQSGLVESLLQLEVALPAPELASEQRASALSRFYADMSRQCLSFFQGFQAWDDLDEAARRRAMKMFDKQLPAAAVDRYGHLYRRLAADVREFELWAGELEHRATRRAMQNIEEILGSLPHGQAPDFQRHALGLSQRAYLSRSVLADVGEAPAGVAIPTLQAAYIDPDFRVAVAAESSTPGAEGFWQHLPVRSDLGVFLASMLIRPEVTDGPLLLLGQPGAGKSVLTKVLAARLPPEDFLTIRVELREVPADADVQAQIESAVRTATGEQISWPVFARAAGDALPVVLLDGFDELIQATGVSQSDYLIKVAIFQQREADQGRPVAVVVTSRTAIADRARARAGTVMIRLEPFRRDQIDQWLEVWNRTNVEHQLERGPLDAATVMRHPALSSQPLLLLMLALYDSESGALRDAAELDRAQLYEVLLRSFAGREVGKRHADRDDDDYRRLVDEELLRLSLVAFAMFNRDRQWATAVEVSEDLDAVLGAPVSPPGIRAALSSGHQAVGRFFFIQRAAAVREGAQLVSYEFLHATFGEYLIARLVDRVLHDLAGQERAAAHAAFGSGGCQDGLLHALLSFAPLTARGPVVEFLRQLADRRQEADRQALAEIAVLLFRRMDVRTDDARFAKYVPGKLSAPARYARYGLNLVLLAAVYGSCVHASRLVGCAPDTIAAWRSHALLWQSTLTPEQWLGLLNTVSIDHLWHEGQRDLRLDVNTAEPQALPVDMYWTYNIPPRFLTDLQNVTDDMVGWGESRFADIARQASFTADPLSSLAAHTLESIDTFARPFAEMFVGFPPWDRMRDPDAAPRTILHDIMVLWMDAEAGISDRDQAPQYRRALLPLARWNHVWDRRVAVTGLNLVLHRLVADAAHLTTDSLVGLLDELGGRDLTSRHVSLLIEAALNHLAARRPTSSEFATLAAAMHSKISGRDQTNQLRWLVGLWETGYQAEAEIGLPEGWLTAAAPDVRLHARASWLSKAGLDRGVDVE